MSSVALSVALATQSSFWSHRGELGVSHELHPLLRSLSYGTGILAIAVRPYAHKYAP